MTTATKTRDERIDELLENEQLATHVAIEASRRINSADPEAKQQWRDLLFDVAVERETVEMEAAFPTSESGVTDYGLERLKKAINEDKSTLKSRGMQIGRQWALRLAKPVELRAIELHMYMSGAFGLDDDQYAFNELQNVIEQATGEEGFFIGRVLQQLGELQHTSDIVEDLFVVGFSIGAIRIWERAENELRSEDDEDSEEDEK